MSGSKRGAAQAKQTNLEKDPDFYKKLGSMGGKSKVKKGLAKLSKERRKEISQLGIEARKINNRPRE